MSNYQIKYIKYKIKYLIYKNQYGGKLPYIKNNIITDFFPFDNFNYNFYYDEYSIINNNSINNYLLNDKYQLLEQNLDNINELNKKNIINNNNIYKLADEKIIILPNIKIPFHLCLLETKYEILDNLYTKYINLDDISNSFSLTLEKVIINKDNYYYKFNEKEKNIFFKYNAKKIFNTIFQFDKITKKLFNISNNYNILLKYSFCNKFLELLKLIYDIQTQITYDSLQIISINKLSNKFNYNLKNIKIKNLINNKYDLDDFIIINLINFFIPSTSLLKNNLDKIYECYISDSQEIKEIKEIYVNMSDITLLFKYIKDSQEKEKSELKNKIIEKYKINENSDLNSFKNHLEKDIEDIKYLLFFNLYVDNNIIIKPNFSRVFYASFISYRINIPSFSYKLQSNLYPININNFICNLLGINYIQLLSLINKDFENLSINKLIFYSNYIKPPIHTNRGFLIKDNNYKNCAENATFEFIKILFWNQKEFVINLPDENIDLENKTFKLLCDIFDNFNKNLENIYDYFTTYEHNHNIHKLFSNHKSIIYCRNDHEMNTTIENFKNVLCIILNFKSIEKLDYYLENINQYNNNITNIKINNNNIKLFIYYKLFYLVYFGNFHAFIVDFNANINLIELINYKYKYIDLLIYNSNNLIKFDNDDVINNNTIKNSIHFKNIAIIIIKNNPRFINNIPFDHPDYNEILKNTFEHNYEVAINAISKNPELINYDIIKNSVHFKDIAINAIHNNSELINYDIIKNSIHFKDIAINTIYINPELINYDIIKNSVHFKDIVINVIKKNPRLMYNNTINNSVHFKDIAIIVINNNPELINYVPFYHPNFNEIFKKIFEHNYKVAFYAISNNPELIKYDIIKNSVHFKDIAINLISNNPELINDVPFDHPDFNDIFKNTFKNNHKVALNAIKIRPEVLKLINIDHPYYKYFAILAINTNPKLINVIPFDHPDFNDIFKNTFKNNHKVGYYAIEKYPELKKLI
jgi:hypothetical protein